MRRKLFWRLYLTYLVVVVFCAAVVGGYATTSARNLYLTESENDLAARARLVEQEVAGPLGAADSAQLQAEVVALDRVSRTDPSDPLTGTRVTIIDPRGVVLADSQVDDPSSLENHAARPEVQAALQGKVGRAIRHSETLNEDMMYVAVPVRGPGGGVAAVVRTAVPLTTVDKALDDLYLRIAAITAAIALITALVGLYVSRRLSRLTRDIAQGAERFASGDLEGSLPQPPIAEFADVTTSLNRMAGQLSGTIATITQQRNEREAMLASMVEGVLAVDPGQRVISMNEAAARQLGARLADAQGRSIEEVIRNPDLQRFVSRTLSSGEPQEGEIVLRSTDPRFTRYLQVHGAHLRDAEGQALGAVVVLNDVTRLRRLETVRRDFVANVSHELKTPVTSIKGFAETLVDGALDDRADAERFAGIIAGQADRLNAIIEDLLSLSRLEEEEQEEIPRVESRLGDVLQAAVDTCRHAAAAKGVELAVSCPPRLSAPVNVPLLEQAVVNLVDNAVKYSPDGAVVELLAREEDDEVVIAVTDHGCGIAREHLPRLFERFYRVDKARSRDLGGTGLGLAIVKHIARVHGGRVSVDSTPEVGSTFRIHLPA